MNSSYSIIFNNLLEAGIGTISPGICVCLNTTGDAYVVSTLTNRGSGFTYGIVTFTSQGGKAVQVQTDGVCSSAITNIPFLAGAFNTPIRVNAGGTLERANPVVTGDEIVGRCDQFGNAILIFGGSVASLIGNLAGDANGPPGSNIVTGLQSAPISNTPSIGDVPTFVGPDIQWAPGGTSTVTLSGDADGPSNANTVVAIQNIGINATPPTAGQVLTAINATSASWQAATSAVTLAGDVTGASNSNRVTTISGTTIGNAVAMTPGVHLDWAAGSLSSSLAVLQWTGNTISIVPSANARSLMGGISPTVTGLWFGANAAAPSSGNVTLSYNTGSAEVLLNSAANLGLIALNVIGVHTTAISWLAGDSPLYAQDDITSVSAAQVTTMRAQRNGGSGSGGNLVLQSGASQSGTPGNVRLEIDGLETLVEVAATTATRGVLALVNGPAITTELGTTSGDRTVYLANAGTVPSADAPGGGAIFYGVSGNVFVRTPGGLGMRSTSNLATFYGPVSTTLSGLWFGTNALTPSSSNYSVLSDDGNNLSFLASDEINLMAGTDIVLFTPTLTFDPSQATPLITQVSSTGATSTMIMRGQGSTTGTNAGGNLAIETGLRAGASSQGKVSIGFNGGGFVLEAIDMYNAGSNRVVAISRGSTLTPTQMPSGSGDLVAYIGEAGTAPSADPVSGGIFFVQGGALKYRSSGGVVTTLAAA